MLCSPPSTGHAASKGFLLKREHIARLNAVTVFEHDAPGHACPLCPASLPEAAQVPSIGDMRTAQDYIGERSGAMDSATPRIESAIQEVETKLADVRRRLDDNRVMLTAVKRSSQRLQLAVDTDARRGQWFWGASASTSKTYRRCRTSASNRC